MSSGRMGRGRGWGRGSHLSHNLDVPHQPLDLCQCHKDWIAFCSMRTYLFMYFCLFLYFYFTWFTCHSSKGILSDSKDLLRRDPHFFLFFFFLFFLRLFPNPKFRPGMSGICHIWQGLHRVFSGCSRPRPLCAFSQCFFFNLKHIAL